VGSVGFTQAGLLVSQSDEILFR